MKTIAKITKRQKEFLEAIYSSIETEGYPPTFEDLKNKFNISSNQAIIDHLKCLEKKGFIKRDEKSARGINITQDGFGIISKNPLIPFGGTSYAGNTAEPFEITGEWKKLSNEVQIKDDVFIIQISGDSMIDAGIFEGDFLIAQPRDNFVKGDIVVAEINGETTVKRFMTQDHAPTKFLKPENKKYDIILFKEDTRMTAKIIGKFGEGFTRPLIKGGFV